MGFLAIAGWSSDTQRVDVEERLKQLEIFSKLTEKQIRKLAGLFISKRLAKGEVFIRKGDTGLGMYLIVSGRVEVFDTRDGSRVSLATLDAGKVVGEMSLMDARPRSANVEAIEDTECLLITRDSFNGLTRRDPEVLWGIVPLLVDRLRHADKRLAELDDVQTDRAGVVAVETAPPAAAPGAPPAVTVHVEPAATTTTVRVTESADTGKKRKTRKKNKRSASDALKADEDDDDEDDEDDDGSKGRSDESVLRSVTQLSAASFMLMSSTFLLVSQESLRFLWSKD